MKTKTNKCVFYSVTALLLTVCFIFLGCGCSSNSSSNTNIRYMCSSDELEKAEKAIDYCEQYLNDELTSRQIYSELYDLQTWSSFLDDDFEGDKKLNDLICDMSDLALRGDREKLQKDVDELKGLIGEE